MKKMQRNVKQSLQCEGVKLCERCGKEITRWHYLIASSDCRLKAVCADDRLCREPQQTRKQKQLQKIQERWSYEN